MVVRSFFLFLSRRKRLRRWMETSPLAKRLATRFVAGDTLDQAVGVARRVGSEGIAITLDHLGESVASLAEAAVARDVYLHALSAIHDSGIQGHVSLKLTQRARGLNGFVRVDMESSQYTQRTIDLVADLHARYGAVGVVVQAYLYRSQSDIEQLCDRAIRVRLCKGAYLEPGSAAFPRKSDVDRNFVELMTLLLDRGAYPAIATHDENIIRQTEAYAAGRGIRPDAFEFQMLYGIRRDLQRRLAWEGYRPMPLK